MQLDEIEPTRSGNFARIFCVLSIAVVSGAIIHNAVYAQQSRVFSQGRISISSDSTRLDKLFSVLNVDKEVEKTGHTRVSVQPLDVDEQVDIPPVDIMVLKAQQQLADLGHYSGADDGVMGAETRIAIMRYQQDNGLAVSGRPDPQFLEHLQYVHHIHQASTVTGSTTLAADSSSIERAQRKLRKLGYDAGPIDGKIGAKTANAIRLYQTDMQLPADGELSAELLNQLAPSKTSQID